MAAMTERNSEEVKTVVVDDDAVVVSSTTTTQQQKMRLPIRFWSAVAIILTVGYIRLLPLVLSLILAAGQLVLFICATFGGYYGWTLVQNLFVERDHLVNEIVRRHDISAKINALELPTATHDSLLPSLEPKSIESVLRDWNIEPEIARGGSWLLNFIVRDFILKWYNGFISDNEDFPKATTMVMILAVGKFSNRLRFCATTEFQRLWIIDAIIKILSKKFNWYRTMRTNAEEAHPEVFEKFRSLKPGEHGTAEFFARLATLKQVVVAEYRKKNYLHHICAEQVSDGCGGTKEDTTRRQVYFRHLVTRVMHLLLEPTELSCESGFTITREVLSQKVFPFLPGVICSKNLNSWTYMALKKVLAKKKQVDMEKKNGRMGSVLSEHFAASYDDDDTIECNESDPLLAMMGGDEASEVPPVISCLLPEDLDLFFSFTFSKMVREVNKKATNIVVPSSASEIMTMNASTVNISAAKTSREEALGALEGESRGSFLLRVVDRYYICVSVVCDNSDGVRHFLVRAVSGQGFQVEDPLQSKIHPTLVEMLQSLDTPLYQLIKEHSNAAPYRDENMSFNASVQSSGDVHSHFRLNPAQLRSLNPLVKSWQGGQSRIIHIPFQVVHCNTKDVIRNQHTNNSRICSTHKNASKAPETKQHSELKTVTVESNKSTESTNQDEEDSKCDEHKNDDNEDIRSDPQDLLDKMKSHVDQALPLSFERSEQGGIELNHDVGNALAASINAILQDAMIINLISTQRNQLDDGLVLEDVQVDTVQTVRVSHGVLFDGGLVDAAVASCNGEPFIDEAVCVHLVAQSIRDKDGVIRKVFEQARTRHSKYFTTQNRWISSVQIYEEFLEQLEIIDGALMCSYDAPRLLTEKLRVLKDVKISTHGTAHDGFITATISNFNARQSLPSNNGCVDIVPIQQSNSQGKNALNNNTAFAGHGLSTDDALSSSLMKGTTNTIITSSVDRSTEICENVGGSDIIADSNSIITSSAVSKMTNSVQVPVANDTSSEIGGHTGRERFDEGTESDQDEEDMISSTSTSERVKLVAEIKEAVNQCVMKFFERTVPLTEIDAHPLVLVIEKVLLHGFWGFREDFDKWLDAVFNKYAPDEQDQIPHFIEKAKKVGSEQIILDFVLRFPGVESLAQLRPPKNVIHGSFARNTTGGTASDAPLRTFYYLESATARWQRIYAYLHDGVLDERLSEFLSNGTLFQSQYFDTKALLRSPDQVEQVQTLFEMTHGVQFSEQTDVITEANATSQSVSGDIGNDMVGSEDVMLHVTIPAGLRAGDKFTHFHTVEGAKLRVQVPDNKKAGDTILCLYTQKRKRREKNKKANRKKDRNKKGRKPASHRRNKSVGGSNSVKPASSFLQEFLPQSVRRRALRDPASDWNEESMRELLAEGGPSSKLTAVVVDSKIVIDSKLDLAEPFRVYNIHVTIRSEHGDPVRSWNIWRRYQYFRNLFVLLKEVQPKLRVECPKQHAFRSVFGGGQFVQQRMKELNNFMVDILDDPTLHTYRHRLPILEFLARDVRHQRGRKLKAPQLLQELASRGNDIISTRHNQNFNKNNDSRAIGNNKTIEKSSKFRKVHHHSENKSHIRGRVSRNKKSHETAKHGSHSIGTKGDVSKPAVKLLNVTPFREDSVSRSTRSGDKIQGNVGVGMAGLKTPHRSTPGHHHHDTKYDVSRKEVKVTFELCIQLMEEIFRVKEKAWTKRTAFDAAINVVKNTVIFNTKVFTFFREQHASFFSSKTVARFVDQALRIGWPGGVLMTPKPDPPLSEQAKLRLELRELLNQVAPKSVTNLIGRRTAKNGLYLVWEFLQYEELIHDVLGTIMDTVVQQFEDIGSTKTAHHHQ